MSVHRRQVELDEREMGIIDDYEKCIDRSSSDENRAKCEAKLEGVQGL